MTRGKRIALIVAAIAVVGGVAAPLALGDRSGASSPAYLTDTVEAADVVQTVVGTGLVVDAYTYAIAPGLDPVLVKRAGTQVAGVPVARDHRTKDLRVRAGDRVDKGDILAVVKDPQGDTLKVKAPYAGTVRSVLSADRASAATLVTLGVGARLVSMTVSEYDVAALAAGQKASVTVNATDQTAAAKVTSIASVATSEAGVQSYQAVVSVPDWPGKTRVGMSVTTTITVQARRAVPSVPLAAVTSVDGSTVVRVVGADGTAVPRAVTVGLVGDERVEVTQGLRTGETVVTGESGQVPTTDTGGFLPPRPPGAGAAP